MKVMVGSERWWGWQSSLGVTEEEPSVSLKSLGFLKIGQGEAFSISKQGRNDTLLF